VTQKHGKCKCQQKKQDLVRREREIKEELVKEEKKSVVVFPFTAVIKPWFLFSILFQL
jgi:hypothetical protein